ncbi:hypothetical protein FG05_35042 [Fusarium graminearum]|nr:hypothetical protein FG05_35042 [Fusarium graminearum]
MASRANNCVSGFLVSILLLVLATSSHYMGLYSRFRE